MAELVGAVGTSHIPAVGVAIDKGRTEDPYWAPYFAKLPPLRAVDGRRQPRRLHRRLQRPCQRLLARDLIPTFALGTAARFRIADEGFGPRPVPEVIGHPELAWHLGESLILDEFDMTLVQEMEVDHGLTVPLSVAFGQPDAWPCKVIPLARQRRAVPAADRQPLLPARAGDPARDRLVSRRRADRDLRHRRPVAPAAGAAGRPDQRRVGRALPRHAGRRPGGGSRITHLEYLREAGSEGIELVMWLIMRGAMNPHVKEIYRATHVPTSNTHNGVLVLENA